METVCTTKYAANLRILTLNLLSKFELIRKQNKNKRKTSNKKEKNEVFITKIELQITITYTVSQK